jgi:Do/DeqQ family serine protease
MVHKLLLFTFLALNATTPEAAVATDAAPRETPVVRAVRKVGPAVVNISSEKRAARRSRPFSEMPMNPFFENFFRDFFDPNLERSPERTSLGSGVIIDGERGFILTNAHVISGANTITVVLRDERKFKADIVGVDPDSDLAVLRIDSDTQLPSVEMGSSEDLMIGETVIAIGNPFGFSHTVTTGVVSAVDRSIRSDDQIYHNFIQIDASINPGNSGGPLLNIQGDLIGINTAIYAKAQGIGFAIPIDTAKKIVSDLIRFGEVVPAWIGLTVQPLEPRLAQYMELDPGSGVLVKEVQPNGPAAQAGIESGDIVLSVDDQPVSSVQEYRSAMRGDSEGDRLAIEILRNGSKKRVGVVASVFPEELAPELAWQRLGVRVEDLPQHRMYRGRPLPESGVMIGDIRSESYLDRIGAKPGDVIRQMDDLTINSVADFNRAMIQKRQEASVVILLQRGSQGYYITIRL